MQLIITVQPDGNVQVSGPIANKLIAYGMLEMAKEAIKNYNPAAIEVAKPEQAKGLLLQH